VRLHVVMRDADALGQVLPEAGLRAGVRHAQPAHKAMSIDQSTLNTRDADQFGHFVNHHGQILVYGIYGRRQASGGNSQ